MIFSALDGLVDLEDLSLYLLLALHHPRRRLDLQLRDPDSDVTTVVGREDDSLVGRNGQLDPGLLTTATGQSRRRKEQEHEEAQRELERNPHDNNLQGCRKMRHRFDATLFFQKTFLKKRLWYPKRRIN
ncbi:MAG: hypothetical protein A2493_03355 [Candidatus Magasanikbacteria bacterium RIFOXYC12_FULL_33_11]|uniref:Uncharacterized protein n=1 Tax=Candidatus Magasanikbacteria bacterium RIFOXYC12_FULL_33_11 TaxID=1798701 RepID=A0A1F6NRU6_9BACT|nr:MAG: hypothetical protein A2493_03355 [Candidatus Magasanikbacteria bacterium RIFOXYC12_FULL_33_11]